MEKHHSILQLQKVNIFHCFFFLLKQQIYVTFVLDDVEIARILIENGAKTLVKDSDGQTPLDVARENGE